MRRSARAPRTRRTKNALELVRREIRLRAHVVEGATLVVCDVGFSGHTSHALQCADGEDVKESVWGTRQCIFFIFACRAAFPPLASVLATQTGVAAV